MCFFSSFVTEKKKKRSLEKGYLCINICVQQSGVDTNQNDESTLGQSINKMKTSSKTWIGRFKRIENLFRYEFTFSKNATELSCAVSCGVMITILRFQFTFVVGLLRTSRMRSKVFGLICEKYRPEFTCKLPRGWKVLLAKTRRGTRCFW